MPTEISGSTGVNKIQDGTVVNADVASNAAIAGSKLIMPTGSVLQVVSSTKTDTASFSGVDTWHQSGLSVTITPSSSTSKVLITGFVSVGNTVATAGMSVQLRRGTGTSIGEGDAAGSRSRGHSETDTRPYAARSNPINYLDSPGTTSAVTYHAYLRSGSNTLYLNMDGENSTGSNHRSLVSTLTAMEIAG